MELELFLNYVGNSLKKINSDVEKLHSNLYNNDDILDHISSEVVMLENHIQYFSQINQAALEEEEGTPAPEGEGETPAPEEEPRVFTVDELAQYNGKEGAPAYVAVKGVVYDVTNNPLWAGGNHFFGLTAGRDLTNEFAMCHPGAMVLSVLPVVGTLATE
jgi:predicted heme/steroid binding protein